MAISIYPHPVEPEAYPEYGKRKVKVVTRTDLDDRIQFTALRVFTIRDNKLVGFRRDLDIYTKTLRIGKIIWPFCSTLYASNFGELVDEIERRKLWLFDFWGYVPGSDPSALFWGQYRAPKEALEYMRQKLGTRFLGMDNGEQDGRYIGGYAPLACPASPDRSRQWEGFYRFFEALGDDLQHQLSVLCSLNYGHYFAKEADSTILGEESGQALPNVNVWFSYLRGASRQYGILTFGNASIWNRWGYKSYESEGREGGVEWGPACGTSLSLLRRLLYTEYLYGCEILGFEQSWILNDNVEKRLKAEHVPFEDDPSSARLSPVGEVQVGAVDFVEKHGRPGVLHVPVALFMDFHNGWTFPRHLYTAEVYKVWGNRPYEAGDYQVDALFSLFYPGYEDAGFFRDERGFVTPTPHGDSVDVLFSDVRGEVLASYALAIVAGQAPLDLESADKLARFAESGGRVVLSVAQLPRGAEALECLGVRASGASRAAPAGTRTWLGDRSFVEKAFHLVEVETAAPAETLATAGQGKGSRPLILRVRRGRGSVDLICAPFGLADLPAGPLAIDNSPEKAVPHPVALLEAVAAFLRELVGSTLLLDVGNPSLQFCVAVRPEGAGRSSRSLPLTVSVSNSTDEVQPFSMHPRSGRVGSMRELDIPGPGPDAAGYYPPTGRRGSAGGGLDKGPDEVREQGRIGPGEVRLYHVELQGVELEERPRIVVPDRSRGMALSLREPVSLRREILSRPTLLEHVSAVKLGADYLLRTEALVLRSEGSFLERMGCGVIVDLAGLLDFYPGLTLLDNIRERWEASLRSIEEIFDKAAALGARSVLLSLHRNAENHFTAEQAERSFRANLKTLAGAAASRSLSLYLEHNPWRRFRPTMRETLEVIRDVGAPNLRPALDLGHAIASRESPTELLDGVELVLLSVPGIDRYGQLTDDHAPIAGSAQAEAARELYRIVRGRERVTVCLDALYEDWDSVTRDLRWLRG